VFSIAKWRFAMPKPEDDTAGQPRRATDSRPRPGSGTPQGKPDDPAWASRPAEASDRKPSASWSPIDPSRPVKKPKEAP